MKIQIKQYIIESEIMDAVRGDIQQVLGKLKNVGEYRKQKTEVELEKMEAAKDELGADNVEKIKDQEQQFQNFEESIIRKRDAYIKGEPFASASASITKGISKKSFGKQSKLAKEGITNKEEGPRTVENNQAKHASGLTGFNESSDLRSFSEIQKNTPNQDKSGLGVALRNAGKIKQYNPSRMGTVPKLGAGEIALKLDNKQFVGNGLKSRGINFIKNNRR